MKKDETIYVGHMLDLARLICEKIAGKSRQQYDRDENLRFALVHLIQNIGEAARRVSPDFQQSHPAVAWRQIVGMRHKIVHDYLDVDYDLVWDVVSVDVPQLITKLEEVIPSEGPGAVE
jgi:uncharacterized protein with HEPN domain